MVGTKKGHQHKDLAAVSILSWSLGGEFSGSPSESDSNASDVSNRAEIGIERKSD